MDFQTSQEIRCESIPISSGSDDPKNALFFHRFPEQGTDSVDHADIRYCSIHSNDVATVQCIECVNNGLPVKQSYHCSNKCFLDAWKNHYLHHYNANVSKSCNEDTKARGTLNRCNSWPPGDMVSWFDEKIEVVIPTGRMWVNKLGPSNALIPSADGIGFSFKLQSEAAVCAEEILVTDPTIQRLNFSSRSLIWLPDSLNTEKHDLTKKVSKVGSFKVLTYNILSDIYVYVDKYPYCPEWALTWEYRRKNLLRELINYNADILCLQEVQSDHFENFFKPELESFGYFVAYKKKTKEVYTGSGYTIDGCATFYRNDIFKEVMSYELEYSKSALSLMEKLELSLRDHARVRLIKDNIALAVILEVVGNSAESAASSRLCVVLLEFLLLNNSIGYFLFIRCSIFRLMTLFLAFQTHYFLYMQVNTHIYADVKLLQVSDLVNEIEKTIDPKMPLFICGDMNSFPGSDPYILLTKHEVDIACAEAPDPLCIFQHLKLHHSMKLASAYASTFPKPVNDIKRRRMKMKHSKTGEPLFTSLTPFYGSTLDYIFYTGILSNYAFVVLVCQSLNFYVLYFCSPSRYLQSHLFLIPGRGMVIWFLNSQTLPTFCSGALSDGLMWIAWKLKGSWSSLTLRVWVERFPPLCGRQTILHSWEAFELLDHSW